VEGHGKTREHEKQNILNVTFYPTELKKGAGGGEKNRSKEVWDSLRDSTM
jgi:hypothetical protein